jgi:hypothetical protein
MWRVYVVAICILRPLDVARVDVVAICILRPRDVARVDVDAICILRPLDVARVDVVALCILRPRDVERVDVVAICIMRPQAVACLRSCYLHNATSRCGVFTLLLSAYCDLKLWRVYVVPWRHWQESGIIHPSRMSSDLDAALSCLKIRMKTFTTRSSSLVHNGIVNL